MRHTLVEQAWDFFMAQDAKIAAAKRAAVKQQRVEAVAYYEEQRARLAADPAAIPEDLAQLDRFVDSAKWALDRAPTTTEEEQKARLNHRRSLTAERVRKHRALRAGRKAKAAG